MDLQVGQTTVIDETEHVLIKNVKDGWEWQKWPIYFIPKHSSSHAYAKYSSSTKREIIETDRVEFISGGNMMNLEQMIRNPQWRLATEAEALSRVGIMPCKICCRIPELINGLVCCKTDGCCTSGVWMFIKTWNLLNSNETSAKTSPTLEDMARFGWTIFCYSDTQKGWVCLLMTPKIRQEFFDFDAALIACRADFMNHFQFNIAEKVWVRK